MSPRRTQVKMIEDFLKGQSPQQAMPKKIAAELGWTEAKVRGVVKDAEATGESVLNSGPGGVIKFTGTERGHSLLYGDVSRVLENKWSEKQKFRDPLIFEVARGGRRQGLDWIHPDLILRASPARKTHSSDKPDLHTFEVERKGGFKIVSIYQAFVQGRGATYSWVIYHESDVDIATNELDRVIWAAKSVDVGLISYKKPGAIGTWKIVLKAKKRTRSADDLAAFVTNTGIGSDWADKAID